MSVEVSVLDSVPAFASLGPAEKEALAGLVVRDHLEAGDVLFEQEQPAEEVFVLLDARVELSRKLGTHGDKTLLTVGPGEILGWAGMMPYDRIATARVSESGSVLRVEGWALTELCEKDHEVGFAVMKALAFALGKRMRDLLMGVSDSFGT